MKVRFLPPQQMSDDNKILVYSSGKLIYKDREFRVALGKGGVSSTKQEGDGATPTGCFPIRKVYYRADRINTLETSLEAQVITEDDGWCDNPKDSNYNKYVKLPYPASAEKLWREDNLYDIIVTLGYNDNPPIAGKGSAIFMHIARENYSPTAGCIALSKSDLLDILKSIDIETKICIEND